MSKVNKNPTVGVIMGSKSDWDVMKNTCDIFKPYKCLNMKSNYPFSTTKDAVENNFIYIFKTINNFFTHTGFEKH